MQGFSSFWGGSVSTSLVSKGGFCSLVVGINNSISSSTLVCYSMKKS